MVTEWVNVNPLVEKETYTVYRCSVCHRNYANAKDAEKCSQVIDKRSTRWDLENEVWNVGDYVLYSYSDEYPKEFYNPCNNTDFPIIAKIDRVEVSGHSHEPHFVDLNGNELMYNRGHGHIVVLSKETIMNILKWHDELLGSVVAKEL
jgi:hypothetical protein